jgi:hypothetical protein
LRPDAIESFDDRRFGLAEHDDFALSRGKAELSQKCQAKMLVLDALREIQAVVQTADRRLQYVRGRGGALWDCPSLLEAKQSGFFLNTDDGNAEFTS